ncbi:hypothetical protein ACFS27_13440 [Promicromonospora vindobonensis]|uniref:Uncharacterized protein n=1 Tax=Promicromonospora vindobonensis TaxID=195748 RepID=A0ABW5VTH6_9MICO
MTELAYMVREDWAQQGTAMEQSSATIRSWLGDKKLVYAVGRPDMFNDKARNIERGTAMQIGDTTTPAPVVGLEQLSDLAARDDASDIAVVAIHPRDPRECDAMRNAYETESLDRMYVQIWAPSNLARSWVEGQGAIDLHTGRAVETPDPVQVAGCELIVNEEYNGLSTGNGKDTVIQVLRSFNAEGYPLDTDTWLRAYFSAGGAFRHAEVVKKFVEEVAGGKRHRVTDRFLPEIVGILREQVAKTPPK